MSWPATNTSRILVTGTSLTQTGVSSGDWAGRPGSLVDQIRAKGVLFAAAPTQTIVPARAGQAAPASYSPLTATGRRQTVLRYGVAGRKIADLQADLQASIYSWAPDICIIEACTNDFGGATDVTAGGAFQTSYAAVLDGIRTNLPNCKVLCLSVTCRNEVTAAGPHFNDGTDTWAGNTRIVELCNGTSTVGTNKLIYPQYCLYVDVITPALNYSVINNLPFPGGSSPRYLTQDSLHQTNVGAIIMANAVMGQLSFS